MSYPSIILNHEIIMPWPSDVSPKRIAEAGEYVRRTRSGIADEKVGSVARVVRVDKLRRVYIVDDATGWYWHFEYYNLHPTPKESQNEDGDASLVLVSSSAVNVG